MMSPKQYLFSIGAIKEIGRGRLSKDNIELCRKGAAEGKMIQGYTVESKTDSAGKIEKVVKKEIVASSASVVSDYVIFYEEDSFMAREIVSKKERSMRSGCNNCKVSLVQCHCGVPTIVAMNGAGSVRVEILPKKASA